MKIDHAFAIILLLFLLFRFFRPGYFHWFLPQNTQTRVSVRRWRKEIGPPSRHSLRPSSCSPTRSERALCPYFQIRAHRRKRRSLFSVGLHLGTLWRRELMIIIDLIFLDWKFVKFLHSNFLCLLQSISSLYLLKRYVIGR